MKWLKSKPPQWTDAIVAAEVLQLVPPFIPEHGHERKDEVGLI